MQRGRGPSTRTGANCEGLPCVLTLIVYERERRALGSFLAPSARGAASCSSRHLRVTACAARAARLPALATDIWHLYNMADIDNKEQSELVAV